jgi:hypothetical protein
MLLVTVIIIALLVVSALLRSSKQQATRVQSGAATYEALPGLMTPAERSFFGVLQQALVSGFRQGQAGRYCSAGSESEPERLAVSV